jgi:hypothetical protein
LHLLIAKNFQENDTEMSDDNDTESDVCEEPSQNTSATPEQSPSANLPPLSTARQRFGEHISEISDELFGY